MSEEMINSTHKIKATPEQFQELLDYYKGYLTYNNNPYVIARVKMNKVTITFYKTNVILFQGENEAYEYNIWAKKYNLECDEEHLELKNDFSNMSCIGSDEVGTGDYFGPITVCAAYVPKDKINELKQLGVKDSKLLTDPIIIQLGLKIAEIIPYSIIYLEPNKLNRLSPEHSNLNFIKAYLHNKAINSILKKLENVKYDAIVIDEFTPKEKYFEYLKDNQNVVTDVTMVTKGETECIAVAAASILARVAFLRELKKLSSTYKIDLLKGAGPEVDRTAISFVRACGYDELKNVAKLKYANTLRIKEYFRHNPLPRNRQGHIFDE